MKKAIYAKDKDGFAIKTTLDDLDEDLLVISKCEYDRIVGTQERLILSRRLKQL